MTFDPDEKKYTCKQALFQFEFKNSTMFSSGDKISRSFISLNPEVTSFDLWSI